jgi:hypothetical protein
MSAPAGSTYRTDGVASTGSFAGDPSPAASDGARTSAGRTPPRPSEPPAALRSAPGALPPHAPPHA